MASTFSRDRVRSPTLPLTNQIASTTQTSSIPHPMCTGSHSCRPTCWTTGTLPVAPFAFCCYSSGSSLVLLTSLFQPLYHVKANNEITAVAVSRNPSGKIIYSVENGIFLLAPVVGANGFVSSWKQIWSFIHQPATKIAVLAWDPHINDEKFFFVFEREVNLVRISGKSAMIIWSYSVSIPIFQFDCSRYESHLAISGKIDRLVRVVGPRSPLQYLRHPQPVLLSQWNQNGSLSRPTSCAPLLTLDVSGVLRVWYWNGPILVQGWISSPTVIAAQWINYYNETESDMAVESSFDEAIPIDPSFHTSSDCAHHEIYRQLQLSNSSNLLRNEISWIAAAMIDGSLSLFKLFLNSSSLPTVALMRTFTLFQLDLYNPLLFFRTIVRRQFVHIPIQISELDEFPTDSNSELVICAVFKDGTSFSCLVDKHKKNGSLLTPFDFVGGHKDIEMLSDLHDRDIRNTVTVWNEDLGALTIGLKPKMRLNIHNAKLFCFIPLFGARRDFYALFQNRTLSVCTLSPSHLCLASYSCNHMDISDEDGFPLFSTSEDRKEFTELLSARGEHPTVYYVCLLTRCAIRVWKVTFSAEFVESHWRNISQAVTPEQCSVSISFLTTYSMKSDSISVSGCKVSEITCASSISMHSQMRIEMEKQARIISQEKENNDETNDKKAEKTKDIETVSIPLAMCGHEDGNICIWGISISLSNESSLTNSNSEKDNALESEQQNKPLEVISSLYLNTTIHQIPAQIPSSTPLPFSDSDKISSQLDSHSNKRWDEITTSQIGIGAARKGGNIYMFDYRFIPSRISIQSVFRDEEEKMHNVHNDSQTFSPPITFGDFGMNIVFAFARKNAIYVAVPSSSSETLTQTSKWTIAAFFPIPKTETRACSALSFSPSGALLASFGNEIIIYNNWLCPSIPQIVPFKSIRSYKCQISSLNESSNGKMSDSLLFDTEKSIPFISHQWSVQPYVIGPFMRAVLPSSPSLPLYHPLVLSAFIREDRNAFLALVCLSLVIQIERSDQNNLLRFVFDPSDFLSEEIATKKVLEIAENDKERKKMDKEEEELSEDELMYGDANDDFFSDFADSSNTTNKSAEIESILHNAISRLLPFMTSSALPYLSGVEQMQLSAILDTVVQTKTLRAGSIDSCGLRFLIAKRLFIHACRVRSVSQENALMMSSEFVWALHSEAQRTIVEECCHPDVDWERLRSYGIGFWAISNTITTLLFEHLAKVHFSRNKNPEDAALFYVVLGKKATLCALYKACKDTRLATFLSNDFTTSKWKMAAAKSAYTLNSQHRYSLCAAFFVLAGQLEDAIQIILTKMNDVQSALLVARHCGQTDLEKKIIIDYVIPKALSNGDIVQLSIAHWLLKEYIASFRVLSDLRAGKKGMDPSVLSYSQHLITLPVIRLDESFDRVSIERSIARRAAVSYCVSGCPFVAAAIVKEYQLLAPCPKESQLKNSNSLSDTNPPLNNMDEWDFSSSSTKNTNTIKDDWDFDVPTVTKKQTFDWDFDDENETDNTNEKSNEKSTLETESNSLSAEEIQQKIDIWDRSVLAHTLTSAAVMSVMCVLKDVDFIAVGNNLTRKEEKDEKEDTKANEQVSKSNHNTIADELFEYAKTLISFWAEHVGMNRTVLEYKIVRSLFSLGYLTTMSRFSIGQNFVHNAFFSIAVSSVQWVTTTFRWTETTEIGFVEVLARRLLFLVAENENKNNSLYSEEVIFIIKYLAYFFLFFTFLIRCEYEYLRELLRIPKLDDAFIHVFNIVPVERLSFPNAYKKLKSAQITSEALKLFAVRLSKFISTSTYHSVKSFLSTLNSIALSHSVHSSLRGTKNMFIELQTQSIEIETDYETAEEIVDEERTFENFAREQYSQNELENAGWRVPTQTKSTWKEKPLDASSTSQQSVKRSQKTVIVSHKDPVSCFCLDDQGFLGALTSKGSVHEFSHDSLPRKRPRSVFFQADIERVYKRPEFTYHRSQTSPTLLGNHVGINAEWIESMPGFPYYLVTCGDKPLKLYHYQRDVSIKPLASLVFTSTKSSAVRCCFNSSGTVAAACSHDGHIEVWSIPRAAATESQNSAYSLKAYNKHAYDLIFLNDGTVLASAGTHSRTKQPSVCLWNTLEPPRRAAAGAVVSGSPTAVAVSDDKNYLVAGDKTGTLYLIDVRTLSTVKSVKAHEHRINSISIAGDIIATGSSDSSVKVWRLNSLSCVEKWEAEHGPRALLADFNGTTKVTSSLLNNEIVIDSSGHDGTVCQRRLVLL